ncbi:thiol reductant ABC exporter subunit CydD, partial [Mycobacteroides abscessus subsp. massiliense]
MRWLRIGDWSVGLGSGRCHVGPRRKRTLLLDEPPAHLDADTEAAVLATLVSRARQGATVVLVGHRAPVL